MPESKYELYFINTNYCSYHYDFVQNFIPRQTVLAKLGKLIDQPIDLGEFNRYNYCETEKRQFIMGTLIYYKSIDKFAMELNPEDDIPAEKLLNIYNLLVQNVFFGSKLYYKPSSNLTDDMAQKVKDEKFKIISIQEIYQGVTYQCYNKGVGYGNLVYLTKETFDPMKIHMNDIVVVDFVPIDLPPCSGVITSCFQAPLCHISILCQNRGTPNAYNKGVEKFSKLKGKFVKLTTSMMGLEIEPANEKDVQLVQRKQIIIPKFALDSKGYTLGPNDWAAKWCGTKAEHLHYFGNNLKLPKFAKVLNEGFVIPFSAYFKHLSKLPIELTSNVSFDLLPKIQKAILEAEIDAEFLAEIQETMKTKSLENNPWIMRSSTNAEDLVGFNGAGLYNSEIVRDIKDLEDVIKRVWASVFSPKAYQEREIFLIDHKLVGMAILCQPLIATKIIAKGVAMTWSSIHTDFGSFLVNVQTGKGDVTDSSGIPEQIVLYVNDTILVQEVITRSNMMEDGQKHILNSDHLAKLFEVLNKIKRSNLGREWKKYKCAADVEFMICDNNGEIFITVVQVRPFLIPT